MKNFVSALTVIGTTLVAGIAVSAGTLPTGYPPYIDVVSYYASFDDTVLSYEVQSNSYFTADDPNGGYVQRVTVYNVTQIEVPLAGGGTAITNGGYIANGFVNAGLPFLMPNWSSNSGQPFNLAVSSDPNIRTSMYFSLFQS